MLRLVQDQPPAWLRIHRLVNELPLILVLVIFLWAQYTISISLVLSYLLRTRNLVGLSLSISIPFNLFWFASLINLCKCILTGPGWVQRLQQPTAQHTPLTQSTSSYPRNSSSTQQVHRDLQYPDDDEDDRNIDSRARDQASVPLLSSINDHPLSSLSNPTAPFSHSPNGQLSPRPALTSTSPPPYLARRSTTPLPNLSFQEQVQRQQSSRSPHSATDIFQALHFPPPSTSSVPLAPTPNHPQIETLMCKSDGSLRFCRKCDHYKADRSHHCSSCGRCVLRMDHHCPWLGGRCVGLKNHKFFILFLFYTTITCILSALFAAKGLLEFVSDPASSPTPKHSKGGPNFELAPLNWAFLVLVGALFGMVLAGFTSYHFYLISVNRTTIENMERSVRVRPISSNQYTESYALLRTTRLKGPESLTRGLEPNRGDNSHSTIDIEGSNSRLLNELSSSGTEEIDDLEQRQNDMNTNNIRSSSSILPSYDLPIYKSDYQLSRVERKKLESGATKLNLFHRGSVLANLKEIFGNHSPFWHWFLPINPIGISDGYKYEINQENLEKLIDLTSQIRLLPNHRSGELRFERP